MTFLTALEDEEGLKKLGIRSEKIGPVNSFQESDSGILPQELYGRFDEAYGNGSIGRKKYAEYLELLITQSPPDCAGIWICFNDGKENEGQNRKWREAL